MASILSQNERKASLEREASQLRAQLMIAETEISRIENSEKVSKTLSEQLEKVKQEIEKWTKDRDELLQTVSSLHAKMRETDNSNGILHTTRSFQDMQLESPEGEGEEEKDAKNREAYLNVMLLKAKQEKQKAVRIIVHLLGKETVQELLSGLSPQSPNSPLQATATNRSPSLAARSQSFKGSPPARAPSFSQSAQKSKALGSMSPGVKEDDDAMGSDLLEKLLIALQSPKPRFSFR